MGLSRDVKRAALSGIVWPIEGVKIDQIFLIKTVCNLVPVTVRRFVQTSKCSSYFWLSFN